MIATQRGTTLVELLVGLAVGAVVTAIALAGVSATGAAMRKQVAALSADRAAMLALQGIVADLRRDARWSGCARARDCAVLRRPVDSPMLRAGDHAWLVDDGLRRCAERCEQYAREVVQMDVTADVVDASGRVRRLPLSQGTHGRIRLLEVRLRTRDGRSYSRSVARRA